MDAVIDSNIKKSLIKKQGCFSKLTDDEVDQLSMLLIEKPFATGETIVTEGDLVDSVYFIVQGEADVRVARINNNIMTYKSVATLKAGEAIGLNEYGFYSLSGKRTATVVAMADMLVLELSVPKFHGFALAYPHVNEVMRKSAEKFTTPPAVG